MKSISLKFWSFVFISLISGNGWTADAFPSKTIRIVVHLGPGNIIDVNARIIAEKLAEVLKQPVIVENMPGASGMLGIRYVKNAPADGYTILAFSNTLAQGPVLVESPGYSLSDFTAIGSAYQQPLFMVGPAGQPYKTLAELVAYAKANPDSLTFASGGIGTSTYLAASMFLHQSGIKMLHVPYKGAGAALPDVLGGRMNMFFEAENSLGPHIRSGKLRAYAVTSPTRYRAFPDVPTMVEQGLPDYNFQVYSGLVVRTNTPKEVVTRLTDALKTVLNNPAVQERIRLQGSEPIQMYGTEFNDYLRQDSLRVGKLAVAMGMEKLK